MQILLLMLAAGALGYLLAVGEREDMLEDSVEGVLSAMQSWSEDLSERIFPPSAEMQLKTWALGDGSRYFPRQFRDWNEFFACRNLFDALRRHVARIERSEIRDGVAPAPPPPGFAALNPGYYLYDLAFLGAHLYRVSPR